MSINKALISGNIGGDPNLRQTASGMQVLSFSVAVNDRVKGEDGQWTDRPNWIDCVMFGNRAKSVSRFLSKGSKVAIEGKLRWSQWERDGQRRSKIEVIVDEIEFMASRGDGQHGAAPHTAPAPHPYQPPIAAPVVDASVYDDDILF